MKKGKQGPYKLILKVDEQWCTGCVFCEMNKCHKKQNRQYRDISCVVKTNKGEMMARFDYAWRTA